MVHHPAEIETRSRLADGGPDQGIREERAAVVEHRRDGLFEERARPPGERVFKKIEYRWVFNVPQGIGAVSIVRKEFGERKERCGSGLFNEHPERIAKYVFKPRAPRIRPELVEDAHDVGDDQAALFGAWAVERVECKSVSMAFWIENNHVVLPVTRNEVCQEIVAEPTLRVNDRQTSAGGQVRCRNVQQ